MDWRNQLTQMEREELVEQLASQLRQLASVPEDQVYKVVRNFELTIYEKSKDKNEYYMNFNNKLHHLKIQVQEKAKNNMYMQPIPNSMIPNSVVGQNGQNMIQMNSMGNIQNMTQDDIQKMQSNNIQSMNSNNMQMNSNNMQPSMGQTNNVQQIGQPNFQMSSGMQQSMHPSNSPLNQNNMSTPMNQGMNTSMGHNNLTPQNGMGKNNFNIQNGMAPYSPAHNMMNYQNPNLMMRGNSQNTYSPTPQATTFNQFNNDTQNQSNMSGFSQGGMGSINNLQPNLRNNLLPLLGVLQTLSQQQIIALRGNPGAISARFNLPIQLVTSLLMLNPLQLNSLIQSANSQMGSNASNNVMSPNQMQNNMMSPNQMPNGSMNPNQLSSSLNTNNPMTNSTMSPNTMSNVMNSGIQPMMNNNQSIPLNEQNKNVNLSTNGNKSMENLNSATNQLPNGEMSNKSQGHLNSGMDLNDNKDFFNPNHRLEGNSPIPAPSTPTQTPKSNMGNPNVNHNMGSQNFNIGNSNINLQPPMANNINSNINNQTGNSNLINSTSQPPMGNMQIGNNVINLGGIQVNANVLSFVLNKYKIDMQKFHMIQQNPSQFQALLNHVQQFQNLQNQALQNSGMNPGVNLGDPNLTGSPMDPNLPNQNSMTSQTPFPNQVNMINPALQSSFPNQMNMNPNLGGNSPVPNPAMANINPAMAMNGMNNTRPPNNAAMQTGPTENSNKETIEVDIDYLNKIINSTQYDPNLTKEIFCEKLHLKPYLSIKTYLDAEQTLRSIEENTLNQKVKTIPLTNLSEEEKMQIKEKSQLMKALFQILEMVLPWIFLLGMESTVFEKAILMKIMFFEHYDALSQNEFRISLENLAKLFAQTCRYLAIFRQSYIQFCKFANPQANVVMKNTMEASQPTNPAIEEIKEQPNLQFQSAVSKATSVMPQLKLPIKRKSIAKNETNKIEKIEKVQIDPILFLKEAIEISKGLNGLEAPLCRFPRAFSLKNSTSIEFLDC